MAGRPGMVVPVFMKQCAGSWLIASVVIERTMQMSSAIEPICGKSSQISVPHLPNFLKIVLRAEALELCALKLRDLLPLVSESGIGWPFSSRELRLVIEGLEVRRAARHAEVDDAFRLLREIERI